jgi:hypothetical protein
VCSDTSPFSIPCYISPTTQAYFAAPSLTKKKKRFLTILSKGRKNQFRRVLRNRRQHRRPQEDGRRRLADENVAKKRR